MSGNQYQFEPISHDCEPPTEELDEELLLNKEAIRLLYNEGVPLFSKEALYHASRQLKGIAEMSTTIMVKGMDDEWVRLDNHMGRILPAGDPEEEYVTTKPFIYYRSIQGLLSSEFNSRPCTAYCSLTYAYDMALRDQDARRLRSKSLSLSLEESLMLISTIRQSWAASKEYQKLRSMLLKIKHLSCVSKVLGIGLGSPSAKAGPLAVTLRQRSIYQHALIISIREIIESQTGCQKTVKCSAQDPTYSPTDIVSLARNNVAVLEDPQAFLEMDEWSAIVSCAPEIPVKQIVADITRPAMIIWSEVAQDNESQAYNLDFELDVIPSDSDSPRTKAMIRNLYEEFDFPGDPEIFGKLKIYVKRTLVQ